MTLGSKSGLAAVFCFLGGGAFAQDSGELYAPSVWDLVLGAHATELPVDQFTQFACGTNGGPPSTRLGDWRDYQICPAEPDTELREIYFEYDNELELWAKANSLLTQAALYQYTSISSVPVIASGLFDENGFLAGLRLVTDPRISSELRAAAISLSGFLRARFEGVDWIRKDLPRIEGEQPFQGRYEKQRCEASWEQGVSLVLETHNYRRPGQLLFDPVLNRPTEGAFWTETRFEMHLADGVPDAETRLAEINATTSGPTETEILIAEALDCPGCDLCGANLKRANLEGANLAGADLTGANLHEANLRFADLSGAILDDANLNGADMLAARLAGASLRSAMMYSANLDGADLTEADLTQVLAGHATMSRADFTGAVMLAIDLRDSRLTDSVFVGADMRFSWFHNAQMIRADFSGARLSDTLMHSANLTRAILVGADLYYADLTSADLRFADLSDADLSFARLTRAIMTNVTTTGALWEETILPGGLDPR